MSEVGWNLLCAAVFLAPTADPCCFTSVLCAQTPSRIKNRSGFSVFVSTPPPLRSGDGVRPASKTSSARIGEEFPRRNLKEEHVD